MASALCETDDTAARLLAILICRPKLYDPDELDSMLREECAPKVHDWLVNYVVKKNPHAKEFRLRWFSDRGQGQAGHRFLDFDSADDLESLSEGRWTEMKHSEPCPCGLQRKSFGECCWGRWLEPGIKD